MTVHVTVAVVQDQKHEKSVPAGHGTSVAEMGRKEGSGNIGPRSWREESTYIQTYVFKRFSPEGRNVVWIELDWIGLDFGKYQRGFFPGNDTLTKAR